MINGKCPQSRRDVFLAGKSKRRYCGLTSAVAQQAFRRFYVRVAASCVGSSGRAPSLGNRRVGGFLPNVTPATPFSNFSELRFLVLSIRLSRRLLQLLLFPILAALSVGNVFRYSTLLSYLVDGASGRRRFVTTGPFAGSRFYVLCLTNHRKIRAFFSFFFEGRFAVTLFSVE